MATWIVHLRIAEKLIEQIPGLDAHQFAIGNIAPDSGIPDENWEIFDPPKNITHYLVDREEDEFQYRDMDFYSDFLANDSGLGKDKKKFSFFLGYFFHLITDNLWLIKIGRPSKEKYLDQFESWQTFSTEIKKDWYGLDFAFVRDDRQGFFWKTFLKSAYKENYLNFYPIEAIPRQIEFLKNFYQRVDKEIEDNYRMRDHIYLDEEDVNKFLEESISTLMKVYELLWVEKGKLKVDHSILERITF